MQPIRRIELIDAPAPCVGIRSIVRDVKARTEAKMIQSALETFGWNRRRAAQYLNMSYRGHALQNPAASPQPVASRRSEANLSEGTLRSEKCGLIQVARPT